MSVLGQTYLLDARNQCETLLGALRASGQVAHDQESANHQDCSRRQKSRRQKKGLSDFALLL
jgi:hypothetical protein